MLLPSFIGWSVSLHITHAHQRQVHRSWAASTAMIRFDVISFIIFWLAKGAMGDRSFSRSQSPPLLSGGELCFCCVLQRHPVSPALLWCVRSTPLSSTNLIDTSILFQSKPMFGSMKNHSKRHAFDQSANRSSLSRFRDFFWSLFLSSPAIDLRTHHNTKKIHKIFDPAVSATCFLSYVDEAHFVSRRNPEQYSCWSAGTT